MKKEIKAEIEEMTPRKGSSSKLGKLKLTAFIFDAVHHKDIIDQFLSTSGSGSAVVSGLDD